MKIKTENEVTLQFPSQSSNEGFIRSAVACFAAQMDPTLNEMEDIKTNPILEKVGYMADLSVTPPTLAGMTTFSSELYKQIQLLELGQTTPEKAVADMKTQIEINLDAGLVEYK